MKKNISNKKRNIKLFFSFLFLIGLIIATFCILFNKFDYQIIFKEIRRANIYCILLAMSMAIIYLIFESLSTKSILNELSIESSFLKNFKYTAIDYYFCAITPSATGGQPLVAYYMKKDGIGYNTSAIVLIFNTIMFKLALLFLGVISLIGYYQYIFDVSYWIAILFFFGFGANIFLIVLFLMALFMPKLLLAIFMWLIKILGKIHVLKKTDYWEARITDKIDEYTKQGQYIRTHPWLSIKVFVLNVIQRMAFFSIAYFVYISLGNSAVSYFGLVAIQVIIALAVDTLPLPGGVGLSESLMLMLFEVIYIKDVIAPAMLITRTVSFYFCLILTMIIVIINHIIITFRSKKGEVENVRIL